MSSAFADLLGKHLQRTHTSVNRLAILSDVPQRTIANWLNGSIRKPHQWQPIVKIALALHLTDAEVDALLRSAKHHSLSELRRTAVTAQERAVLQAWPTSRQAPNQSQPSPNYFVGRRDLISEIKKYLLNPGGLKVCGLIGLGGVGKTTLAKRLAEALEPEFPDGILWGELNRSDTESILNQFAGDYGEDLTQYSNLASKASLVRSLLSHKRALIVLDNAENDEQIRYLLPPKVSTCAILITSRKKLKTFRGWEFQEVKGFDPKESLALFQRFLGKTVVGRYQSTLTQMAKQLGHLPLAVLILASYLQHRPDSIIEQLPEALNDRRARMNFLHVEEDESVRLTFELSWDALSSEEQQSLALLSQFGGRNFSTLAAAALWNEPLRQTKNRLTNLANLSLIEPGQSGRWGLHPLIHDYLTEKAEIHYDAHRQPVTQRLVEHFTHTIQQSSTAGYRHLAPDLDNIIQALDNSYTYQLWDLLARSSPSTLNLLETFGRYEAIDHLGDKALTAAERLEDDTALAMLLYCLAAIDTDGYMNYKRAVERANLGLAIAHDLENWVLACEFNFILARAAWGEGDADLEKQYWAKIEQIATPRQMDDILLRLAEAQARRALWQGNYEFAEKTLSKFIQYARRVQKTKLLWQAYDYLAYVYYRKGDFRRADIHYQHALDVSFKMDGLRPVTVLLGCAQNAVAWGKLDLAQAYADEALNLTKSVARPIDILDAHIYSGDVALARAEYTNARQLWEKALQIAQANRARTKECVTLARLGRLCMLEGNLIEAENFLEQALQMAVHFRQPAPRGYVYEQLAYLAAAKGDIQQTIAYGEKCLEIYNEMRLREANDFRKWLHSIRKRKR